MTLTGSVPTKKVCGAANRPLPEPQVNQHVVASAVGDDQVGHAVAVEVGHIDVRGVQHAVLTALLELGADPLDWTGI